MKYIKSKDGFYEYKIEDGCHFRKKKIGDFTLVEIKKICAKRTDCSSCPFAEYENLGHGFHLPQCPFLRMMKHPFRMDVDREIELKEEDIEDKLGIDLPTMFKAMLQGIFYIGKGTILYCDKPKLIANITYSHCPDGFWSKEAQSYNFIVNRKGLCVLTSQYGKTWALTKEELENNK